jgi:hypothetical protein
MGAGTGGAARKRQGVWRVLSTHLRFVFNCDVHEHLDCVPRRLLCSPSQHVHELRLSSPLACHAFRRRKPSIDPYAYRDLLAVSPSTLHLTSRVQASRSCCNPSRLPMRLTVFAVVCHLCWQNFTSSLRSSILRAEEDMPLLPSPAPTPSCSGRCLSYHSRPGFAPDRLPAQRRLRWRTLRPRAEFSASGDAAPDDHRAEWERADHEREAERLFRSAQLQERQRIGAEYGEVCAPPRCERVHAFYMYKPNLLLRIEYIGWVLLLAGQPEARLLAWPS